ncbi:MAG: carbohydrate kinase [Bacteroidota bacterium]|uniref:Carbohydrate kinase n=1 Tax=Flagellimonas profundi TaxID=2915620 RepID=A0ABS3FGS7_9FLAO|nr:carbohydrate kinase [Allomuricauda profundi]MBO0341920.1 carbohydrate kinase [Allomuricauda profundi]MEC7770651.1 carbohydrate kinase [Bacteroidota bacterium]
MKKVYCIGELLIDFVAERQGSDLSKANVFTKKAGGAPANVACAISKLGGNGVFIGCVGEDPFGKFLLETLKKEGVDISLAQLSKTFTTLAFVSLSEDGERDFVFSRGADRELKYNPDLRKNLPGNILHLGAATALLGGPLEKTYTKYLFDGLTKEMFISFDPNFRIDLWKEDEETFIKKCMPFVEKSHLCKFSLEEAQLISGKEDLHEACDVLHKAGTKIITVTLGKDGTLLSMNGTKKVIPSVKVAPVDTTGAGDSFIGCLLYQISDLGNFEPVFEDFSLVEKMVAMANKAGAITTTNYGAIVALPTKEDLEK